MLERQALDALADVGAGGFQELRRFRAAGDGIHATTAEAGGGESGNRKMGEGEWFHRAARFNRLCPWLRQLQRGGKTLCQRITDGKGACQCFTKNEGLGRDDFRKYSGSHGG